MKNWIKIILVSFLFFAVMPLNANAATSKNNLTVENDQVAVSLNIPEGKTGAVTSLRLQLRVSAVSGTMEQPSFTFDSGIKSEIKDAAVIAEEDGSYLVDLILSGKKDKDIFGDNEYVKLGMLSPQPSSEEYEIKVEIVGEMDDSGQPVVRYVDASGTTAMTAPLTDTEPVIVNQEDQSSGEVFTKTPTLKASAKNGSKSVSFSWSKIEGADGYVLYEVSGNKDTKVKELSASTRSASKNYSYATTHKFKICAYKKASDGSKRFGNYSPVVSVTVGPDQVKSFSPQYKSTTKVTLSWKKTSGATGYEIYRSTKKSSGYKLVQKINKGSTTSYTMKHESGKLYYYKVKAYITKSGKTIYGNFSSASMAKTKAPALKASVKSKSVTLKWNKVSRAAGYKVYRCKTKTGKYKLVKTLKKPSQVKFTEKLPKGSKVWYYKVCAYEKPKKGSSVSGNYSSVVKAKAK